MLDNHTKRIIIVRHGETAYNALGIVQGRGVNAELNEKGWLQSRKFCEYFDSDFFDLVVSSTLVRSQQTVSEIVKKNPKAWVISSLIDEISWGKSEGLANKNIINDNYNLLIDRWSKGDFDSKIEEGETAWELAARCQIFIDWLQHIPHKNILICTHGRTIRVLIALLKGLPLNKMEEIEHTNTGWYDLKYKEDIFVFNEENSIKHLA